MKNDLPIKNGIVIPEHELVITTSRAGGPGGQHVNKTDTKITIRWNIKTSNALTPAQKERLLERLASRLTSDGEIIVHHSSTRSQQQNKRLALDQLAQEIRKGLHVPKKRRPTTLSKSAKEKRRTEKQHHSGVKKIRRERFD